MLAAAVTRLDEPRQKTRKPERETLILAVVIYALWLGLTFAHRWVPTPLLVCLGGWVVAWHGSLQHETIHGHPTQSRTINALIGSPPLEHRAAKTPGHRIAIVENAPVLGLLFLNNNLHAVHHAHPGASWSQLPHLFRRHRSQIVSDNGSLIYDGYAEVFTRFLFASHDDLFHPTSVKAARAQS